MDAHDKRRTLKLQLRQIDAMLAREEEVAVDDTYLSHLENWRADVVTQLALSTEAEPRRSPRLKTQLARIDRALEYDEEHAADDTNCARLESERNEVVRRLAASHKEKTPVS